MLARDFQESVWDDNGGLGERERPSVIEILTEAVKLLVDNIYVNFEVMYHKVIDKTV